MTLSLQFMMLGFGPIFQGFLLKQAMSSCCFSVQKSPILSLVILLVYTNTLIRIVKASNFSLLLCDLQVSVLKISNCGLRFAHFIIQKHFEPLDRKHKIDILRKLIFSGESLFNFADTIFIVSCHFIWCREPVPTPDDSCATCALPQFNGWAGRNSNERVIFKFFNPRNSASILPC